MCKARVPVMGGWEGKRKISGEGSAQTRRLNTTRSVCLTRGEGHEVDM